MARLLVVIEKGESSYGAYSPDVPGCVTPLIPFQRFHWQYNPHRHPLARRALNGQAAARDSEEGAVSEQAAAGTGSGAVGRDAYAIVSDDDFQIGIRRVPGGFESQAQRAVDNRTASVAGGVAQSFLHSRKDEFSNGRRDHFIDMLGSFLRDTPVDFVEGVLEILLKHS